VVTEEQCATERDGAEFEGSAHFFHSLAAVVKYVSYITLLGVGVSITNDLRETPG
jgi:hypothetical protein